MKFIKTFESLKDQSNIEDILLEFEDSGEISGVVTEHYTDSIRLFFDFNIDIRGIEKLKVLDKIISKLRRKYRNICISDDYIQIDLKFNSDTNYDTDENLVKKVEKYVKSKLTNLNSYQSNSNTDVFYYGKTLKTAMFEYNKSEKRLYFSHNPIGKFIEQYMLNYSDITEIVKTIASEILKIELQDCDQM